MDHFIVAVAFLHAVTGDFVYHKTMPDDVQDCFDRARLKPVDYNLAEEACVRAYFNRIQRPNPLTKDDVSFFESRTTNGFGMNKPSSGKRIRRDVRLLSDTERQNLWNAFNKLYEDGTIQRFGRLHGVEMGRKHKGAAFLPWHRVLLVDLEEEMRKIDPSVSLPYWDYTMDYYIHRPADSVVWSQCFFGNGNGSINSGPFVGWYGGYNIEIRRNYASGGASPPRLINRWDIDRIMEHCNFEDITTGTGEYYKNTHNLELLHDGVHDWIGGDMGSVPYAAYDPVFWMHHTFIDYIWEKFRQHQHDSCNVDLEADYRPLDDLAQHLNDHLVNRPDHAMQGYDHLTNSDGLWLNWTTEFYSYESSPECPTCGNSPFLYCDKDIDINYPDGICVSRTTDACKIRPRRSETSKLTRPPTPCDSDMRFEGLDGDGRTSHIDADKAVAILKSELDKRHKAGQRGPTTSNGNTPRISFSLCAVMILSSNIMNTWV